MYGVACVLYVLSVYLVAQIGVVSPCSAIPWTYPPTNAITDETFRIFTLFFTAGHPCGLIWAHVDPYGPTWANMGKLKCYYIFVVNVSGCSNAPHGPIWAQMSK